MSSILLFSSGSRILSSKNGVGGILVLSASALTKVHPGAGRSPGVVDLPVVRDPLGYPFIPGSMIKGSLRSLAERKAQDKVRCLFGPDVSDPNKHAGALAFSDLYPLFVPAPSIEHGVVYLTSPALLSRAAALLREAGRTEIAESLEKLASGASRGPVFTGQTKNRRVSVGSLEFEIPETETMSRSNPEFPESLYNSLNPLYNTLPPKDRILVVPEEQAVLAVDAQLLRVARVRLDDTTKTVAKGGLWTEEYLPWGTLFLGAIFATGFKGSGCDKIGNPLLELVNIIKRNNNEETFSIVVGGKETVGSGLLRAKTI
ncbi:MAG: type III-B CRISPR module RAMP protein Cmr4 [Desulfurococcales archaeon]|nr:type III-B CRISPR module RAMP protein Cmr4 [Desulfurococcales archaeon]